MASANINGQLDSFTKANGREESNTDQECGEDPKEILISVNGNKEKPMDMECTPG